MKHRYWDRQATILGLPIATAGKWAAEYPNLYTLEASIADADATQQTVGMRQAPEKSKEPARSSRSTARKSR